jgi:hypothetical protein
MILWANWSEYLGKQTKINNSSVPLLILSMLKVRQAHSASNPKLYNKFDLFKKYVSWSSGNLNNEKIDR